ncbi:MAG TPA: hypothetical protein VKY82_08375 [Flavobacterium sp.]|nr:hypothetical protein [Flavobacterium sp.]
MGNSFASNEVNLESDLKDNVKEEVSTSHKNQEHDNNSEDAVVSYNCSTTTYGYYSAVSVEPSISPNLEMQNTMVITYKFVVTGQCTTCYLMGHNGVTTTTACWGTKW